MVCLHNDADNCGCRKPKPGLLLEAAVEARHRSQIEHLVGDRWRDVRAGQAAGCGKTVRIDCGLAEDRLSTPDRTVKSLAEAADYILEL